MSRENVVMPRTRTMSAACGSCGGAAVVESYAEITAPVLEDAPAGLRSRPVPIVAWPLTLGRGHMVDAGLAMLRAGGARIEIAGLASCAFARGRIATRSPVWRLRGS